MLPAALSICPVFYTFSFFRKPKTEDFFGVRSSSGLEPELETPDSPLRLDPMPFLFTLSLFVCIWAVAILVLALPFSPAHSGAFDADLQ